MEVGILNRAVMIDLIEKETGRQKNGPPKMSTMCKYIVLHVKGESRLQI